MMKEQVHMEKYLWTKFKTMGVYQVLEILEEKEMTGDALAICIMYFRVNV